MLQKGQGKGPNETFPLELLVKAWPWPEQYKPWRWIILVQWAISGGEEMKAVSRDDILKKSVEEREV